MMHLQTLIHAIFNLSLLSISLYRYTGKRVDNIEGAMLLLVISNTLLHIYFFEYLVVFSIINLATKICIQNTTENTKENT